MSVLLALVICVTGNAHDCRAIELNQFGCGSRQVIAIDDYRGADDVPEPHVAFWCWADRAVLWQAGEWNYATMDGRLFRSKHFIADYTSFDPEYCDRELLPPEKRRCPAACWAWGLVTEE